MNSRWQGILSSSRQDYLEKMDGTASMSLSVQPIGDCKFNTCILPSRGTYTQSQTHAYTGMNTHTFTWTHTCPHIHAHIHAHTLPLKVRFLLCLYNPFYILISSIFNKAIFLSLYLWEEELETWDEIFTGRGTSLEGNTGTRVTNERIDIWAGPPLKVCCTSLNVITKSSTDIPKGQCELNTSSFEAIFWGESKRASCHLKLVITIRNWHYRFL